MVVYVVYVYDGVSVKEQARPGHHLTSWPNFQPDRTGLISISEYSTPQSSCSNRMSRYKAHNPGLSPSLYWDYGIASPDPSL